MKDYRADGITVHWDAARCIHFGVCTRGLPSVFDVSARPWIRADGASPAEVAAVIEACPTGALRYSAPEGGPTEIPPVPTRVRALPGGPLLLQGDLVLQSPSGEPQRETRVALCRCGRSGNQPFCDNSHRAPAVPVAIVEPETPADICTPQP